MPVADYVNVQFGYSDVFEETYNLRKIIEEMKEYNLWAVIMVASKLALIVARRDGQKTPEQLKLLRSIFSEETRDRIVKLFERRNREDLDDAWVFFSEPPILSMVSVAMTECSEVEGKDLKSEADLEKFGGWILAFSEEWTKQTVAPRGLRYVIVKNETGTGSQVSRYKELTAHLSKYSIERLRRCFAEQSFLTSRPNLLHLVSRTSIIVHLIKGNPSKLDIESLFKEATGVGIEDYLFFAFCLMAKWSITDQEIDEEKDLIRDKSYFSNIDLNEDTLNKLMNLFVLRPREFAAEHEAITKTILKGKNYQNNFMVFMRRPLIISDVDRFMCISPRLLAERGTNGIYWHMNEYLNRIGDSKRLNALPQAWAYGFESYVNQRLATGFGKQFIPNFSVKKNEELADGLILGQKALIIIETKFAHWPYKAMLEASRDNIRPSLQQLLGFKNKKKGLGQIFSLVSKLTKNEVTIPNYQIPNYIIPILVSGEDLPADPLNRRYYNGLAASVGSTTKDVRVKPFIILDVEEVEYIESLAIKDPVKTEELLLGYCDRLEMKNNVGMPTEVSSFKNYLDTQKISLKNTRSLQKELDSITDKLRKRFFGKVSKQ